MKHTKEQIRRTAKNFEILADYISKNVSQKFIDMETVYLNANDKGEFLNKELLHRPLKCGASACALGHSLYAIPPLASEFTPDGFVKFESYETRVYPATTEPNFVSNELWHSVFGEDLSSKKANVISRLRQKSKELLKSVEQPDRLSLIHI